MAKLTKMNVLFTKRIELSFYECLHPLACNLGFSAFFLEIRIILIKSKIELIRQILPERPQPRINQQSKTGKKKSIL